MTFLTLGLFSLWACGDKPVTTDTATSQPSSEPASSPTDDPIIEEELEPLEVVAVGFEFLGSWDQNTAELGGWTLDDGTPRDGVVLVHFTNMDFFSEGAGDDDENICSLNALFVNQAAVLDAQEYPWDNPPSNSGMYPLDGVSASTWAGFEGYLTFDGTTATPDSCGRILDERVITVTDDGNSVFPMDGMHFGISYGALTEEHESRLSEAYTDSDLGDYFDTYREAFVSQYIHINHPDASSDEGYDFTGYDWNYARLAGLNEDETLSVVPCEWDETLECYDLIPYDGAQNVFSVSDAFWYEDFPNIDFDILQLGVPDMTEPVEPALSPEPADLVGTWQGPCFASPMGDGSFNQLTFVMTETTWDLDYSSYGDESCTAGFMTVNIAGDYTLGDASEAVEGAREGEFGFTTKTVTPHNAQAVAFVNSSCLTTDAAEGEALDITGGCMGLGAYPVADCPSDFDIVHLDGDTLSFGARPADNDMCTPEKRPTELGAQVTKQ